MCWSTEMNKLHILNKNRYTFEIGLIADNSTVVLIEDGVYLACADRHLFSGKSVYAVEEFVNKRGVRQHLAENVKLIDFSGFVELCCQHPATVSW